MNFEQTPQFQTFKGKTLLSIDFGTKVTGLASYCPGRDPFPLIYGKLTFQTIEKLVSDIAKIVNDEAVDVLIMGLPLYLDGKESEATKRVKNIALLLEQKTKIPLYLQDETLTTYEAEERMKSSARYNFKIDIEAIDELSAQIILEDFMRAEFLKKLGEDLSP